MSTEVNFSEVIREVMDFQDLDRARAKAALSAMVSGQATDAQIGAFLVGMNMKGPTVEEITGFYESLMAHATPFPAQEEMDVLVDVVGTGGDGSHSINISTTAALVVAGTGTRVAKHGNRAASSRSGAADLLMALGAHVDLTMEQVTACLADVGFVFLFAPHCHPAMRFVGKARQELGIRSIFNLIGPLSNPAPTTNILMGVFSADLLESLASMLQQVGKRSAFVVHGAEGMDEFSLAGPNQVVHLVNGEISAFHVDATDFGFARAYLTDIRGGDPDENARITRRILSGDLKGPMRDIVVLNAAAALATEDGDIAAHIADAEASIDDGAALHILDRYIARSQELAT